MIQPSPSLTWRQFDFAFAGTIEPNLSSEGIVLVHAPQSRYSKKDAVPLNKYGAGPFCEFRLRGPPGSSGVYVYTLHGAPVYLGQGRRSVLAIRAHRAEELLSRRVRNQQPDEYAYLQHVCRGSNETLRLINRPNVRTSAANVTPSEAAPVNSRWMRR